jgi:hypothetical protein
MSLLVTLFVVGCGGGDSSDTGTAYKSATITHLTGFDFSKDDDNSTWDNQDGHAIEWTNESMTYPSGEAWGTAVWFNVNTTDATGTYLYMYDAGAVTLDSVTSVDETKWQNIGDPEKSLQVDHVYVFKARDGYVKFKVTSINHAAEVQLASFDAEYKYSASTTF